MAMLTYNIKRNNSINATKIFQFLKRIFFGRFMVLWKNPLSQDKMKAWNEALVHSASGAMIKIFYSKPRTVPRPKGIMVLGHPMGKEAKGYFIKRGHTDILIENGYHVTVFDFNGFGQSSMGSFAFHEDILAVGAFIRQIYPGLPIGYHGISLGGQSGILALARNRNIFDFAIIEATTTTLYEFWRHYPLQYLLLSAGKFILPKSAKGYNFIKRSSDIKDVKDFLMVYSLDDKYTPVKMAKKYQQHISGSVEIWVAKSGGHAEIAKSSHNKEYFKHIVQFIDTSIEKSKWNQE
ncbi:alpha/beta hydrolase [Flagellimonas allohymeniacidonis]|uniref:Serine aminopeptidase S33 domain-containing protein n=1 Tax=Flagellimonas allohymeniacidonis TaxID=2517819 RepID=A0A4Q8QGA1_9FLAO|nr:alpha/beta hydrolase [Allomuricauda hymeniacidonis]TAI49565.1 hypothetical protein EW142_07135 [Allomuricauda hymeniacidonis]